MRLSLEKEHLSLRKTCFNLAADMGCLQFHPTKKKKKLLKCLKKKSYCTAVFDMMFALFHILPKINPV